MISNENLEGSMVQKRQCKFCDVACLNLKTIKNHTLTHYKDYLLPSLPSTFPFECPVCQRKHQKITDLTRHYGFVHGKIFQFGNEEDFHGKIIQEIQSKDPIDVIDAN